jgi:hypothetical protein
MKIRGSWTVNWDSGHLNPKFDEISNITIVTDVKSLLLKMNKLI